MTSTPQIALTVSQLERGQYHWVLMEAVVSMDEDLMAFAPAEIAERPHGNAIAAWVAGYLALRKLLRQTVVSAAPVASGDMPQLRGRPAAGRFA